MYSITIPFPVSEAILCYYATYLAGQQLSPQTIKTYLAGIRHTQILLGLPEPREFSSLPRLRLVQSGIQRSYSQKSPLSNKIRLPITPAILLKIQKHWNPRAKDPDIVMLWAAATVCFFGFFRAGEITTTGVTTFNPATDLAWGDVTIDNASSPQILQIYLKKSKTDQAGKGAHIYIGRTGGELCPVLATLTYMASRGPEPGPFFKFKDDTPLTKAKFSSSIREALLRIGFPYMNFAGHSFRIGAATAAAKVGLEDSTIRKLGRWSSAALMTYIRTSQDKLAEFSRIIANA